MTLLPPAAPRYLLVPDAARREVRLFDLLRPSGPGVAVVPVDPSRTVYGVKSKGVLTPFHPVSLIPYDLRVTGRLTAAI